MLDIQNPTHKHFLVTYLSNLMFESGFCGFAIYHYIPILSIKAYERKSFPSGAVVKNSAANAADVVWSLGWEDLLEKEMAPHSSILGLENSMDRGAWRATVHGVAKSQTWLSN